MELGDIVSKSWQRLNWPSRVKINIDKVLDPAMVLAAANGAYVWGWDKAIDAVHYASDEQGLHRGAAVFGTHLVLAAGAYLLNRFKYSPIRWAAGKVYDLHQERLDEGRTTPFSKSSLRSLTQMVGIGALAWATNFPASLQNLYWDAERVSIASINAFDRGSTRSEETAENLEQVEQEQEKIEISQIPPAEQAKAKISPKIVLATPKKSTHGRFLRTLRWDEHFAKSEAKHGIEKGLLAGLAMRESYGDPLQLNAIADGGAGLMQFQPGTAAAYGLKVYGISRKMGRDRHHGKKLRELVYKHNFNYVAISKEDQRFSVPLSIDASARLLKDNYSRYGNWNAAISAYNRGRPAKSPLATEHVKGTREMQEYYTSNRLKFLVRTGKH